MVKDEKDLAIYRLKLRAEILQCFAEHILASLPNESALELLREISRELSRHDQLTFPKLAPEQSDLASAEVDEEMAYLRDFFNSIAAKILSRS